MSADIAPERFRPDKSREVTWLVFWSHLTPDQEHQLPVGSSQSWNVLRGSMKEDLIERR